MNSDARFPSSTARNRALTVLAVVAGGLAAVITVTAFTNRDPARGVVLEVETATLSALPAPPSTSPNAAKTKPTAPSTPAPPSAVETELTAPIRPVLPGAAEIALPPEKVPPTALSVTDLSISQRVLAVGLEEDGAMEVPGVEDIGWYRHGAVPGQPGATVLVAHVWWGDSPGPFSQLGNLEPGALIEVEVADTVHSYVVVERTMYDKNKLPPSLWRNTGPETLVLITCGGEFDNSIRRYDQNIVVYAVPTTKATDTVPSA
jgi:hypothetical protein